MPAALLSPHPVVDVRRRVAAQQPDWPELLELLSVREALNDRPGLVGAADVGRLHTDLARVAAGEALVLQAGDCAEDPADCGVTAVGRKVRLLDALAAHLQDLSGGKPVLRVGRIAGQFAKPRSEHTEQVDGVELPVYRGHLVNAPEPTPGARTPDPRRLLSGYDAARSALHALAAFERPRIWASHEALVLDYELPLLRDEADTDTGRLLLSSTHFPWIGERTRQAEGAHVALLAAVVNPVACKVGPTTPPDELLRICARLDPGREPGRLTLIARMGEQHVADRLPALVHAVRAAGHPAIWLCDPMHGNTVTGADGRKTRLLGAITGEVRAFLEAVRDAGAVAGGLHLETTPDDVVECRLDLSPLPRADTGGARYTTLCDPRLNPAQALSVVSAWRP